MYFRQNHPLTLYKYFTRNLIQYFLIALFSLLTLIFFIDLVELFRRSSNKINVNHLQQAELIDILVMASLKITGNIEKILPFAVLIGSISCFNQWRKNNYYVVSRTAGLSLWKMLSPSLICFFVFGILSVMVINPFSSILNEKYNRLQSMFYGKTDINTFSFDTKGFWMKQFSKDKTLIINANRVNAKLKTLIDVNVFVLDKNDEFESRILSKNGQFSDNKLKLYDVKITNTESETTSKSFYSININTNTETIDISIIKPENIFIVNLPNYIINMKKFGLNTSKHLVHLFKLICQPLIIISMILLSASLMLRSSERKIEAGIISISLVVGFSLYFIGDFIFALGSSEKLPPILSGFGPTLIGLFSGCYLISEIDEPKKTK